MRTLLALALVLAACGCSDRSATPAADDAPPILTQRGSDPLVLRVSRKGGSARAYAYGKLDSVLWTSKTRAPAIDHVLAFDPDAGMVAFVDTRGQPGRIDFRLGGVSVDAEPKLTGLASADGRAIFGIAEGEVVRLTPTGEWAFRPPLPARQVFPQPDGALLVLADYDAGSIIWRMHPPDNQLLDTIDLPRTRRAVRTQVGDRIYFTVGSELIGVRARDLSPVPRVSFDIPVRAVMPTPSGDRIYVSVESVRELHVIDRYEEKVTERIELTGAVGELRMDPLGRYALAQMTDQDSAWVIALGTDRPLAAVATEWRADLPTVAPDGDVVVVQGQDVVFIDPESGQTRRQVARGAQDFWYFFLWDGFRPRAAGLDEPVDFRRPPVTDIPPGADTLAAQDSVDPVDPVDTVATAEPPRERSTTPSPPPATPPGSGFMVSFAALLDEARAQETAREIRADGQRARVVTTQRDGATIYRVVLGPYPTREEAERIARLVNRPHWIFPGAL